MSRDAHTLEYAYSPAATLLRLEATAQKADKSLAAFRHTVNASPELFRQFEALDIDVWFALDGDYISISFAGDGEKLKTVWGKLRHAGFNTSLRPKPAEPVFHAFWAREGSVQIFMSFSSTMCRRVKVGTETIERDVFEVQCGPLPEIEPAPVAADEIPL